MYDSDVSTLGWYLSKLADMFLAPRKAWRLSVSKRSASSLVASYEKLTEAKNRKRREAASFAFRTLHSQHHQLHQDFFSKMDAYSNLVAYSNLTCYFNDFDLNSASKKVRNLQYIYDDLLNKWLKLSDSNKNAFDEVKCQWFKQTHLFTFRNLRTKSKRTTARSPI